ncbi:MAG: 1-acyl-sn-glycerol-3-phosphate acyltransferase [Nitrospirae bacterium]|nr:1-acyl-sn-glycerol-3-phosphate acyltransferase [Nitrospirota bacterium]
MYELLYRFTAFLIRVILRINGGIEIKGLENVPLKGGAIIAANHVSYIDPPLLGAVTPRRATFMARKGLFELLWLNWFIKHYAIPVNRERTQPSTIKETIRRLKGGELIAIFPEGRRSESGEMMKAKRGVGMIVSLSKVPVVPTLIAGSEDVLPVDAKWLRRGKITVVFGKPIYYTPTALEKGTRDDRLHEEISEKVMTAISDLKKTL